MVETKQGNNKICFLIEKIGPYHVFRLQQIQHLKPVCIETRPGSKRYAWKDTEVIGDSIFQLTENSYGALNTLLNEIEPQVLFITGYGFKEMLWGIAWAVAHGVQVVMQSDSTILDEPRVFYKEWIKKFIVSHCAAALVAGKRSREYISQLGIKQESIFAPYDVVDNDFYKRDALPPKTPGNFILCISRLLPQKNLFFLLDVYKCVVETFDIELVILGNGPLEAELIKYAAVNGLQNQVHFKGFLQKEEVKYYYHHAKALILASTAEPWGLCINEAMSAGLPVLVSDHCGAAEDLVLHGENGFVFSPVKKEDAIAVMKKFLSLNDSELLAMGAKSIEIIKNYNGSSYNKAVTDTLDYIAARKPRFAFKKINASILRLISNRVG